MFCTYDGVCKHCDGCLLVDCQDCAYYDCDITNGIECEYGST